jgi:hypothetical protein
MLEVRVSDMLQEGSQHQTLYCKIKLKFTLEQATKVQRG